jgi:predicted dithiol-disulfide oxidoreductase (DUF899 family)
MTQHQIVTRDEWLAARKQLLVKEKEFTRSRDRLSAERRALPWVKVEKEYVFDGPDGKETLADLLGGHSQLIVKHFMLGPGSSEGCVGCSFEMDHVDGILVHLAARDVGYVAVSRAPWPEIEAFRKRMEWRIKWVSSHGSDFNYDFNVSFTADEMSRGQGYYNYEMRPIPIDELSGRSVVLQRHHRRHLPHLFVLRPRRRGCARHLSPARHRAERPRRNRPERQSERLGAPPRPLCERRYGSADGTMDGRDGTVLQFGRKALRLASPRSGLPGAGPARG